MFPCIFIEWNNAHINQLPPACVNWQPFFAWENNQLSHTGQAPLQFLQYSLICGAARPQSNGSVPELAQCMNGFVLLPNPGNKTYSESLIRLFPFSITGVIISNSYMQGEIYYSLELGQEEARMSKMLHQEPLRNCSFIKINQNTGKNCQNQLVQNSKN